MKDDEILKRLEEIESRAEKATPGPWKWDQCSLFFAREDRGWGYILRPKIDPYDPGVYACVDASENDRAFIIHAREDVPWLCKTVRQLVAQLEEVEAQCAAMREALEEISRTEPDEKPDGTILGYLVHDAYEMSEIADAALRHDDDQPVFALKPRQGIKMVAVRRDYLDKLKAVARAAREYLHDIDAPILNEPTIYQYEPGEDKSWRLRQALALLEEENQ